MTQEQNVEFNTKLTTLLKEYGVTLVSNIGIQDVPKEEVK